MVVKPFQFSIYILTWQLNWDLKHLLFVVLTWENVKKEIEIPRNYICYMSDFFDSKYGHFDICYSFLRLYCITQWHSGSTDWQATVRINYYSLFLQECINITTQYHLDKQKMMNECISPYLNSKTMMQWMLTHDQLCTTSSSIDSDLPCLLHT